MALSAYWALLVSFYEGICVSEALVKIDISSGFDFGSYFGRNQLWLDWNIQPGTTSLEI